MNAAAARRLVYRAVAEAIRPPTRVSLSEWAEDHWRLSPEVAAVPGRFAPYPFQREWLDCFTDPAIERITLMKSARVGYTTCIKVATAYHIAEEPCPIMVVQPTISDGEDFSKEEIAPMIRDTPCLQGLVSDPRSRDSANTVGRKLFAGGYIVFVGANAPRGFRRRNIRLLLFDEIDGYPASAGAEGDPIALGEKRTLDFPNRKIVKGSTPTLTGLSRIAREFEKSDQRYRHVPCPDCGGFQRLVWKQFRWENKDPETAHYVCEHCGVCIPPSKKRWMVERGKWIAENPEVKGHAGFHIWQAYSYNPLAEWPHIVAEWLAAQEDHDRLRAFVNTVLGETWDPDQGEKLDHQQLYERREDYDPEEVLPEGVLAVTLATDVQDNRLETELVGWGEGEERWSLDFVVTPGDPALDAVWEEHDELLDRRFPHPLGIEIGVAAAGIDSRGHHSDSVYRYVKERQGRRVYALAGTSTAGAPIVGRPSKRAKGGKGARAGVAVLPVGTDTAKDLIWGRLKKAEPGPGYMHTPAHYDEEYFLQLTAERPVRTYKRGVPVRIWKVTRSNHRNEALDLAVYNLAVLRLLRPNWRKIAETLKGRAEEADEYTGEEAEEHGAQQPKRRKVVRKRRRRGKGYDPKKW